MQKRKEKVEIQDGEIGRRVIIEYTKKQYNEALRDKRMNG